MISRPPTEEEVRDFIDWVQEFFRSLRHPTERRAALKGLFILQGFIMLWVAALCVLVAIGQLIAVGFRPAWNLYWPWWVGAPFVAAIGVPLLILSAFLLYSAPEFVGRVVRRFLAVDAYQWLAKLGSYVLFTVMLLLPLGAVVYMGYQTAREDKPLLAAQDSRTIAGLAQIVSQQSEALSSLSSRGSSLLTDLDNVEKELKSTREELRKALFAFDEQEKAAKEETGELKHLQDRRNQIELGLKELERILEGQKPITREDLSKQSRSSLLLGILVGFLTSLAGAFAYGQISQRRKARLAGSTQHG